MRKIKSGFLNEIEVGDINAHEIFISDSKTSLKRIGMKKNPPLVPVFRAYTTEELIGIHFLLIKFSDSEHTLCLKIDPIPQFAGITFSGWFKVTDPDYDPKIISLNTETAGFAFGPSSCKALTPRYRTCRS